MPEHEFVAKTLEIDWFAPTFAGARLSGEFYLNGSVRLPGEAILSTKGNLEPSQDTTTAQFQGGPVPRLRVQLAHASDLSIFRDVLFNDWTGLTIFFEEPQLDPASPKDDSVEFKKIRFHRRF